MKKFIKMNTGHNYLSLGNIYNIVNKCSLNNKSFSQVDFFSTIFNTNDVTSTAVNNYLIGYRAINIEYKKRYYDMQKNKQIDDILINILSLLENKIIKDVNYDSEAFDNACNWLKDLLCEDGLAKEKVTYSKDTPNKEIFIKCLSYAILENNQPIYNQDININLQDEDLKEYLKINMYEGMNYSSSLERLAINNNKYACAELGSIYFNNQEYEESYQYYFKAANKDHPKGCWMVANMLVYNYINIENKYTIIEKYLDKAIKLGSVAALNTKGLCYLQGINKNNIKDESKAIEYFLKASEYGYKYAYNNLGKYYENKDYAKAINYYKQSAALKDSWALNKMGEFYRKNNEISNAIFCYKEALKVPKSEICYYAYYNLARYYYLNINKEKTKEYLEIALSGGVKEAKSMLKTLK